jgi:hypothetical protein
MCGDGTQWRQRAVYGKHAPRAGLDEAQIIAKSAHRSIYFHGQDAASLEMMTIRSGTYVASAKPATVYKVHEFPSFIGASEGQRSRWIFIESTSGTFHGYPISHRLYLEHLKHRRECCDD